MTAILQSLQTALEYLWNAPAWMLLLIVLNLLGVFLQWLPTFPNKLIPVVLVVVGVVLLELTVDPATIKNPNPRVVIGMVGSILAAIAYGLHFALIAAWNKWSVTQQQPEIKPPTQHE